MKLLTITTGFVGIAIALVNAADVTYSVIAFPSANENIGVSVGNQDYPLQKSQQNDNLFTGTAPYGAEYKYTIITPNGNKPENTTRHLVDESITTTGNEFFGRSKTVYDIPALPRAFNPIYPPLINGMNKDNEISTILLNADMKSIEDILKEPTKDHEFAQVYNMSYISHDAIYNFQGAGFKNAGQSSKEFAKQSFKIKFNKFSNGTDKLFGRKSFKLRSHATDPTLTREKFMLDSLSAAGVATLAGNWVRVFVNNEPFGLFLMIDDSFKGFTDNLLNGGKKNKDTGATYKGNAMSPTEEANLVYKGPSNESYNTNDVYILEDAGRDPAVSKDIFTAPLIDFMDRLNSTVMGTDAQTPGTITDLMDNTDHTMIHMAMNFLSGSWDGFWRQASNYYLHNNYVTKKWYLITYDFDETFGNGLDEMNLMTASYQNWSRSDSQRPLVDIFLKSPYYEPKFQDILKTLVKRFFNTRVVKPRFEAWDEMLKEDIAWDRSIPFRSPGEKEVFTANDLNNLFVTVGGRIGVLEWISNRTASVCEQLNFNDTDDLPALPAYNDTIQQSDDDKNVNNGGVTAGGNNANNQSGAMSSAQSTIGFTLGAIIVAGFTLAL